MKTKVFATFILALSLFQQLLADDQTNAVTTSLHQNIYRLQHRVLPVLTHQTTGKFFELLLSGETNKLYGIASNEVNTAFADAVTVKLLDNPAGILLTFPAPNKAPECFFVYITKTGDAYRYITLEKTLDIFEHGNKSVVGEWTAEKMHLNRGSRKYDDAESFLAEIISSDEK
jgi:hypothetical protein